MAGAAMVTLGTGGPMSEKPILLFLHGVGTGDRDDSWAKVLDASLQAVGYPGLSKVWTIAPKYSWALIGGDDDFEIPKLTVKALRGESADRYRRDFERRVGAMEVLLGRRESGVGLIGGEVAVDTAVRLPSFKQAQRYVTKESVRGEVLSRVLRELPPHGRIVMVGHSLGSVVAADVLRRLPPDIEVAGLITLGSPLASDRFNVPRLRTNLAQPPANLAWWISFWNAGDVVTLHRGLSSVFPYMLDYKIAAGVPPGSHLSSYYLRDDRVATAIGYALFGSKSKEIARVERGLDVSLDPVETKAVTALRYGHLIGDHLKGERRERYVSALRLAQANVVEWITFRNAKLNRPMPTAILELAVDLADVDSLARVPASIHTIAKGEAVELLIAVAATNILDPYEVSVSKDIQKKAMQQLTLDMGLGTEIGDEVFTAAEQAKSVLKRVDLEWWQWVAAGLGAAAIVVGTGGVALAATPGVAGAAAITSALAAFGPGGMMGGLLSAGALLGVGGGGLAIGGMAMGLASSAASAATVEAVVAAKLTAALLRHEQGLEQDPVLWEGLVEIGIQVRRERARLKPLSDVSAPGLKELGRKLDAIDRALAHLARKKLGPEDTDQWAAED